MSYDPHRNAYFLLEQARLLASMTSTAGDYTYVYGSEVHQIIGSLVAVPELLEVAARNGIAFLESERNKGRLVENVHGELLDPNQAIWASSAQLTAVHDAAAKLRIELDRLQQLVVRLETGDVESGR